MRKLFKKLIPVVLGMMLLSSSTAFAAQSAEAKAAYDALEAKSLTMPDSNIYCHMNMAMGDGSTTLHMAMDMNMLYKNMLQPDQMEYMNQTVLTLEGIPMAMTTWYKDGYTYVDMAGDKSKMKTEMAETMTSALSLSAALGTPSDLLTDLSLTTNGDQRILSYTMDDAKLNEYVTQILQQMGLQNMLAGMDMQFKISDIKGTYTLTPDNYYSDATVSMAMSVTMSGETVVAYMNGTITVLNPGQPVEIAFPSTEGYVDMTNVSVN